MFTTEQADFSRERIFAKEQAENAARIARSVVSPVISGLRDRSVWKDTFTEVAAGALIGGTIKAGTRAVLTGTGGIAVAVAGGALASAGIEYFKQIRENVKTEGFCWEALKPTDLKRIGVAAVKGAIGGFIGLEMADLVFNHMSLTSIISDHLPKPQVLVAGWNNLADRLNGENFNVIRFEKPDPELPSNDVSSLRGLAAAEVARDLLETDSTLKTQFGNIDFDPFSGKIVDTNGVEWHHKEIFDTYIKTDPRYQAMLETYMDQIRAENNPNFFDPKNPDLIYHFVSDSGQHVIGPVSKQHIENIGTLTPFKVLQKEARRKFFEDFWLRYGARVS